MTLSLPFPDVRGQGEEAVQKNLEKISLEWPLSSFTWASYTATVTTVTLGTGGTNVARFSRHGNTVAAYGKITLGTGGSFTGTDVEVALPVPAASHTDQIGSAYGLETGVYRHDGLLVIASGASTFKVRFAPNGTDNSLVTLGATTPFTWGDTDALYWRVTYEAA